MNKQRETILAIESAIGGGSISLLRGTSEIASWVGDASSVSKAENLLSNIDQLLTQSNTDRGELDLIAVSAGPGSFTGIRIGVATALGLKSGLGIQMASETALKAVAGEHGRQLRDLIVALPVGRDSICIQRFRYADEIEAPRTLSQPDLLRLADELEDTSFAVHSSLYSSLIAIPGVIDVGSNIARSIGLFCGRHRDVITEPLFIAKSF